MFKIKNTQLTQVIASKERKHETENLLAKSNLSQFWKVFFSVFSQNLLKSSPHKRFLIAPGILIILYPTMINYSSFFWRPYHYIMII